MAKIAKITSNCLTNIAEIELTADANQRFTTNIDGAEWEITLQTFADDCTHISITKDGVGVCNNAPLTPFVNLLFFSDHTSGGFFFGTTQRIEKVDYTMLGTTLRLYYGYF